MTQFLDDRYQKDIRNAYKPLSEAEERTLIAKAQAGCTRSRNKLVDGQLNQICNIAKMYLRTNPRNEMGDLIGVGIAGFYNETGKNRNGFICAIEDFDLNRGTRLITFALHYIRNAIRDYSQDNDIIRNSRQKSKTRANDPLVMADLEYEASLHSMTVDEYIEYKKNRGEVVSTRTKAEKFGCMSMDTPIVIDNYGKTRTLMDVVADESSTSEDITLSSDIKKMLDVLDDDDLTLVNCFFGLDREKMTLEEIGADRGGISRQAVSNRLNRSLDKMRSQFKCNK